MALRRTAELELWLGFNPAKRATAWSAGQTVSLAAHGTATEQTDDRQQRDGADQRHNQRRQAKVALVDRADPKQRGHNETGQERPDNTHDDIQQGPPLRIGVHDDASEPPDDRPYNDPNDEVNRLVLSGLSNTAWRYRNFVLRWRERLLCRCLAAALAQAAKRINLSGFKPDLLQ